MNSNLYKPYSSKTEKENNSLEETEDKWSQTHREVLSNLHLQMLLHFNVSLLPGWVITFLYCFYLKFEMLDSIHRILIIPIVVAMVIIECGRLYLGYSGNLYEKMDDLAGFWMLTVLLQFPLLCFVTFSPYSLSGVTEIVIHSVLILMIIGETIFSFITLREMSAHSVMKHKIMTSMGSIKSYTDRL